MSRLFKSIAAWRPDFRLDRTAARDRATCLAAFDAVRHGQRVSHPAITPAASRGLSPTA